jgi:hypothetical protein
MANTIAVGRVHEMNNCSSRSGDYFRTLSTHLKTEPAVSLCLSQCSLQPSYSGNSQFSSLFLFLLLYIRLISRVNKPYNA